MVPKKTQRNLTVALCFLRNEIFYCFSLRLFELLLRYSPLTRSKSLCGIDLLTSSLYSCIAVISSRNTVSPKWRSIIMKYPNLSGSVSNSSTLCGMPIIKPRSFVVIANFMRHLSRIFRIFRSFFASAMPVKITPKNLLTIPMAKAKGPWSACLSADRNGICALYHTFCGFVKLFWCFGVIYFYIISICANEINDNFKSVHTARQNG